jgi:hypothetical protein
LLAVAPEEAELLQAAFLLKEAVVAELEAIVHLIHRILIPAVVIFQKGR